MARLFKWLLAVILFASLSLALTAQVPSQELSADESFGATLVLQKKISDDAGKELDPETSLDALLSDAVVVTAALVSSFSTTCCLTAAYLAAFINASPRAPPLLS